MTQDEPVTMTATEVERRWEDFFNSPEFMEFCRIITQKELYELLDLAKTST